MSRLTHPNIAVVHDFDSQDETDFLVMELVPGMTLEEKLLAGPINETEAVTLLIQLLEGLAAAHAQGVIHCDIKPSNLRVTPDGHLKILDFGLAKLFKSKDAASITMSITQDQGLAGTLAYMPPEQLRGSPPDQRTDTYAAGCVLYEITTGQRPFPEKTAPLMIDSILNKTPARPTSLNPPSLGWFGIYHFQESGTRSNVPLSVGQGDDGRLASAVRVRTSASGSGCSGPAIRYPPNRLASRCFHDFVSSRCLCGLSTYLHGVRQSIPSRSCRSPTSLVLQKRNI